MSYTQARAVFHAWTAAHAAEILTDPHLEALARQALALDAEAAAEVARLQAQIDRYQGTVVYHCTEAHAADAMITLTDAPEGAIVRATDTGAEWQRQGDGTWEPRE
ncbi:MAG TPA: TilS substrate-binding domain-containing protein [Streptosporangiaceae bacterium]|nr:TilS substrate-binding domain-containing protein [Streptosporangiaceae bacterium]